MLECGDTHAQVRKDRHKDCNLREITHVTSDGIKMANADHKKEPYCTKKK